MILYMGYALIQFLTLVMVISLKSVLMLQVAVGMFMLLISISQSVLAALPKSIAEGNTSTSVLADVGITGCCWDTANV